MAGTRLAGLGTGGIEVHTGWCAILNDPFNPDDIADSNFAALYEKLRCVAVLVCVYE